MIFEVICFQFLFSVFRSEQLDDSLFRLKKSSVFRILLKKISKLGNIKISKKKIIGINENHSHNPRRFEKYSTRQSFKLFYKLAAALTGTMNNLYTIRKTLRIRYFKKKSTNAE